MANSIYTTDSNCIQGASLNNPIQITSPYPNAEIVTIVAFDNGNIGGVFATVDSGGTNSVGAPDNYRLYFLPNKNFNNCLIIARNSDEGLLEFKKVSSAVVEGTDSKWHLLHRGDTSLAVNDITKIQGTSNSIMTTEESVPQDILLILCSGTNDLFGDNSRIIAIKDIKALEDIRQQQTFTNLDVDYLGKDSEMEVKIDEGSKEISLEFTSDQNGTYTQIMANNFYAKRIDSDTYEFYNNPTHHQGWKWKTPNYTNIQRTMGYNWPTNQKRYRWGSRRDKMIFNHYFMAWAAAKYFDEIFEPIIRSSAMADLQKFRQKIINTISTSSSESEQIAFESDSIMRQTMISLMGRNVTEEEISNCIVNNSVIKVSEKVLKKIFVYNSNSTASFEKYTGESGESATPGEYYNKHKYRLPDNVAIDQNLDFEIVLAGGPTQWGFTFDTRELPTKWVGTYASMRNDSYNMNLVDDDSVLHQNFAHNLLPNTLRISVGDYSNSYGLRQRLPYTSPWIKEAIEFMNDDLQTITKRTYQLDQTIRYNQMEVETISMRDRLGDKNHWARRFITRDNFKSVYLADPKSGYESTILKVT